MENEFQKFITEAKNIYVIPAEEPEALSSALALFYTLREEGKNVNLLLDQLPDNLTFLSPSLDFISYPKNFVVAIPSKVAEISQIYYEKNDEALKIHLTIGQGTIKKENIAFYFSETKPDLIITLGVKDYTRELEGKLQSFGFLLDSPIVNVDNKDEQDNKKFGKINIIEPKPLSQILFPIFKTVSKESATCLLASLIIYTKNFQQNLSADIFEMSGMLMKKGADLKEITKNIYPQV